MSEPVRRRGSFANWQRFFVVAVVVALPGYAAGRTVRIARAGFVDPESPSTTYAASKDSQSALRDWAGWKDRTW
jgi:hypothetical protein